MPAGVEAPQGRTVGGFLLLGDGIVQSRRHRLSLLPLWEKVSPKATDEGCSRESQRLTPLEHPSSVSALRADPPSPTWGEGEALRRLTLPPNRVKARVERDHPRCAAFRWLFLHSMPPATM
ncbi:hypothetical protein EOA27_18780 [Mesorhizobium sp. M2A.F.Ca.ET.037.01.1.1]|nr:hypothetical protein EJ068_14650 [Mesorhizobium sp. M2A.F.Ca.ET.043.02.1.1]AZO35665.1 hypothetical protein EJ072_15170 [Mesorhizobium sp. M2A.F.Ca.ET.046.03.2.1]RUX13498.1 hypothetical protein EOA27_18780 [Mesorhizobium sp. M2A.F.Ca.ET.037.01.1.1]RVC64046.1 hypothetical protein EN759_25085 [Mesorhizobium sp. M00.F.Ca.ET.038.03.1.1]RVC78028.1 hypothetical protein EN766_10280 [Mesorhizobium sp. M2A.F.Ca.ET.046.02.1.1]RVC99192.1 hypothetical protein EN753_26670 [Mesorhizobium sp. M2A.F.Ca.ET.0